MPCPHAHIITPFPLHDPHPCGFARGTYEPKLVGILQSEQSTDWSPLLQQTTFPHREQAMYAESFCLKQLGHIHDLDASALSIPLTAANLPFTCAITTRTRPTTITAKIISLAVCVGTCEFFFLTSCIVSYYYFPRVTCSFC